MSKILFFTNAIRRMGIMQKTLEHAQRENLIGPKSACKWITSSTEWSDAWKKDIQDADMILIKWMGAGVNTPFLQTLLKQAKQNKIRFYVDAAGLDEEDMFHGLSTIELDAIRNYLHFGGERNYYNLWLYIDKLLVPNDREIEKPDPIHWTGIYHPGAEQVYEDLESYRREHCKPGQPTVGMLFYRDEWLWGDLEYQTAIIEELEKQGVNVICVFTNGMPNTVMGMPSIPEVLQKYFCDEKGRTIIGCLINAMKFSMTANGSITIDKLKELNVPILQVYTIMTSEAEWANSEEGMNPLETSISISLPEFDGVIHAVPVAARKELENGDVRYLPIADRVVRLAGKAKKWAMLSHKSNRDKKIAIILHNYPSGNSSIGTALGLDAIESVRRLLGAMQDAGYNVGEIAADSQEFVNQLTAGATNDRTMLTEKQMEEATRLSGKEYRKFFASLPASVQKDMTKSWGSAPGEVMEYEGDLVLPGKQFGNVYISVQPPRDFGDDPEKSYHDTTAVPTHQYLGFYHWLASVWKADAVAHIGTHGNLEWLPGKNAGLDAASYGDIALADLPNIYPYNMTITGEGVQAKRRAGAVLIGHLPAPVAQAGLYDDLEELEKVMDEYIHFEATQPDNLAHLEPIVLEKVKAAGLEEDVVYDTEKPFGEYVEALHNYISDLQNMQVHTGLHVLGEVPEGKQLIDYIGQIMRLDNGDKKALPQAVADIYGVNYSALLDNSTEIYKPLAITNGALANKIYTQAIEFITSLYEYDFEDPGVEHAMALPWVQEASDEIKTNLAHLAGYISGTLYKNIMSSKDELKNILRAFSGEYIAPGPSGSPTSGGADLLPSGRNFFGIDPRTLPTPAAYEMGRTLGDRVIERFIAEEGHYPQNIGIILWSGSNMRSHGQDIAEFLYLLGVKPKYQHGSMRINGLELIPLDELRRPRVDVTARISGLFRDSMPSVMELLDEAVQLVAKQDEDIEMNFVRKHVLEDSAELEKEEGLSPEEAWRQATYRIFGAREGVYGAGVSAILEGRNWGSIDDIADVFVQWGAHAYGAGTKGGQFLPGQFRKRMGSLEATVKNQDNHDTNMLSSDDYNAYHGGMIAAVRSIKGSAPRSYTGDSTDKNRVTTHSVQEEMKRVFRSEAVNPKYIEGLMQHGYKGATEMANMIAHSFQWDATSAVMEDWMYEKYAEKYTFDPKVQDWLRGVNPWALQKMTETLLEAEQRGLWKAKDETLDELQKIYLDMDGELEDRADGE